MIAKSNKGQPGADPVIGPRSFGAGRKITRLRSVFNELSRSDNPTYEAIDRAWEDLCAFLGTLIVSVPVDWLMPDAPDLIDWTKFESWESYLLDDKVADLIGIAAGDKVAEDAKN